MIQFITHQTERYTTLEGARLALEGGCRWVQLRMKDVPKAEIEQTAHEFVTLCRKYDATCILDDEVEICQRVGADGVHLGKQDMDPVLAREILGPDKIIGGTANTYEDILTLVQKGCNYLGLGPFRFTETKKNLSPLLGLEGYASIRQRLDQAGITIPIVAIGGITSSDIPLLSELGYGIALSGTVLNAAQPVDVMQQVVMMTK